MGQISSRRRSKNASEESEEKIFSTEETVKEHPLEKANWISFATFFWMGKLMNLAYKKGLEDADIPEIPKKEKCKRNSDLLEQLWAREVAFSESRSGAKPSFAKVAWQFSRRRIFFTSLVYFASLILGFITPTLIMKRIMFLFKRPTVSIADAAVCIVLLILCEMGRVVFVTLTWALSYRTALRLKTATMGLLYRKVLRVGNITEQLSSKLLNVISTDCNRLNEVIQTGQVSIGGPLVLTMSAVYIWHELGWLPLVGLLVFIIGYPLQYYLSRASGKEKGKAVKVKDDRLTMISQVIHHFKFLKMFGWERYVFDTITDIREKERKYILKSQLLQSFSLILGPTLPHIAIILTFLVYMSTGNSLYPAQAFVMLTVYASRIRPVLARMRSGLKAWFDTKTSIVRIQAFTTLFVFSLLFFSIRMVNLFYDSLYSFWICCDRVEHLLITPETKDPNDNNTLANYALVDEAIVIENLRLIRRKPICLPDKDLPKEKASKKEECINSIERLLACGGSEHETSFHLGPLNMHIKKGSFIGICGHVGSGKTTLLETIAGSLHTDNGTLNIFGRTAYVAQHPWLFKGTLRENVLFGEPIDKVRYYSALDSCCLTNDIAVFPLADKVKLENNGANLSGGQRQRISLARAVYHHHQSDIYLLDDPLSGLDDRVAKTVFEKAITNKLRNSKKTILLASHQLRYLKDCDEIFVLSEGKVIQRGKHEELVEDSESIYNSLWKNSVNHATDNEQILMEDSEMLDIQPEGSAVEGAKKEQLELEKSRKDIGSDVYWLYMKSAGGWIALFFILIAFTLSAGSTSFSSWWIKHWFRSSPDTTGDPVALNSTTDTTQTSSPDFADSNVINSTIIPPNNSSGIMDSSKEFINSSTEDFIFNRNVYAAMIAAIFVTSFFRTILFVQKVQRASKRLHRDILRKLFCIRIKILEKLGNGQIYNTFSRDMDEVDTGLPYSLESFLQNVFVILSILLLVTGQLPQFLVFAIILFFGFSIYRKIYNAAIRDLKRIESRRRNPIITRVSETISGLGTIRAFNKENLMLETFEKFADESCSVTFTFSSAVRWFSIRLDTIAVFMTACVAALIFYFHDKIPVSAAGLALSYAAQLSGVFQFTVRLASETEAKFVGIERMQTFLKNEDTEELDIPPEKTNNGCSITSSQADPSLKIDAIPPNMHPNWPTVGHVKFNAVNLSYSLDEDDTTVLRDLSFEVQAGMNIGIIGRTGSGKSSIGNALFRLVELKSGQIFIDGVDISTIPLPKLRNSMCVIPQEPSVFTRSIRFNLDAGKLYTDHELWAVLEKTGLKSSIESLDSAVGLSHGQKQLLCIARALLRRSKILFVDEATSNMDVETGAIVEKLIAEEFKYSTVFIVAHRTSALASCDNILIMGDGEVKDFGPAHVVSKKPEYRESFEKFDLVTLEDE